MGKVQAVMVPHPPTGRRRETFIFWGRSLRTVRPLAEVVH